MTLPPIEPMYIFLSQAAATHHQQSLWDTLVQTNILNFLIVVAFFVWVFKRFNLGSALEKKQQEIIASLKEAEEKRNKALAELQAIEQRTAQLSREVDSIINEAQGTAEMVAASIVQNAEAEAEKLIANARKRIEMEKQTAARELEDRLMQEAIYAARQLLENTLSDADRHRSVEEFVETLPELYQKEFQR